MKNFASENAVPEGMWHQGEAISLQVLSACSQEILTTIVPSNFKIISLHTGWGSEVRLPCRNLPLENRNPLRGLVCNMGPKGLSKVNKKGAYMISFFLFLSSCQWLKQPPTFGFDSPIRWLAKLLMPQWRLKLMFTFKSLTCSPFLAGFLFLVRFLDDSSVAAFSTLIIGTLSNAECKCSWIWVLEKSCSIMYTTWKERTFNYNNHFNVNCFTKPRFQPVLVLIVENNWRVFFLTQLNEVQLW